MHEDKTMPAKIKRPMTNKEYCAQEEPRCPCCGSVQIEGGSVEVNKAGAWQAVTCLSCGKEWNDIYKLIAYESVE
jgi:transcription elongation factor Elf1